MTYIRYIQGQRKHRLLLRVCPCLAYDGFLYQRFPNLLGLPFLSQIKDYSPLENLPCLSEQIEKCSDKFVLFLCIRISLNISNTVKKDIVANKAR